MATIFMDTWSVMFRLMGGRDLMMIGGTMIAVIALSSLSPSFNNQPPSPQSLQSLLHLSGKAEKFNLRFRSK